MALPGLPGLPNLSATSSAQSPFTQAGNVFDMGGGAWTVNMGGTGSAAGVPLAGLPWLWIAAAAAAVWFLKK